MADIDDRRRTNGAERGSRNEGLCLADVHGTLRIRLHIAGGLLGRADTRVERYAESGRDREPSRDHYGITCSRQARWNSQTRDASPAMRAGLACLFPCKGAVSRGAPRRLLWTTGGRLAVRRAHYRSRVRSRRAGFSRAGSPGLGGFYSVPAPCADRVRVRGRRRAGARRSRA